MNIVECNKQYKVLSQKYWYWQYLSQAVLVLVSVLTIVQGSYCQEKSGKTERVREKSGNFKIPLTRPIIYALFSQFLSASGGFSPRPPPGLRPCKHCRLVYIAIFYNGTKFSITFVYLVLFYWCRE